MFLNGTKKNDRVNENSNRAATNLFQSSTPLICAEKIGFWRKMDRTLQIFVVFIVSEHPNCCDKASCMRKWIKAGAASVAFLPMLIGILMQLDVFPQNNLLKKSVIIFNFPALGLVYSADLLLHFSKENRWIMLIISTTLWSSFLGWVFWRIAGTFLGEDEPEFQTNPERAKFDWAGFRIRFVIGFVVGFLFGWRFVRSSRNTSTILIAMVATGLFAGLTFGLYRPNFWSRS